MEPKPTKTDLEWGFDLSDLEGWGIDLADLESWGVDLADLEGWADDLNIGIEQKTGVKHETN